MKRLLLFILLSFSLFSGDFRDVSWGMSREDVFTLEILNKVVYEEKKFTRKFKTYKGNMEYIYAIDEYSFYDEIESLGNFKVTFVFLEDKLIKTKYEQELSTTEKGYERMKKYLVWKYGSNYEMYGFEDNFVWKTDRSKIILDLIPNRYYTVEYYANTKGMVDYIYNIENAKEFQKSIGTEYEEFNSVKDKI